MTSRAQSRASKATLASVSFQLFFAACTTFGAAFSPVTFAAVATPAISSSSSHTLALNENAQIVAWGSDVSSQLGQNRPTGYFSPQLRAMGQAFRAVAAGGFHKIAVDTNGEVWTWGFNGSGQLGLRTEVEMATPAKVTGVTTAFRAAGGNNFSAVLTAARQVIVWGNLQGSGSSIGDPVARRLPELDNSIAIAAGQSHLLALKADGTVWATGTNSFGAIGDPAVVTATSAPVRVLTGVRSIVAGGCSSLAIMNDGTLRFWGSTVCQSAGSQRSPIAVSGVANVVAAAALRDFGYALTADGQVFGWDSTLTAVRKTEPEYANTVALAGVNTLYLLKSDGSVTALPVRGVVSNGQYSNLVGELCGGTSSSNSAVATLPNGASQIAAGDASLILLSTTGRMATCGSNQYGQSGDGLATFSTLPRPLVHAAGASTTFTQVHAGAGFSLAVDTNGQLYAWGGNLSGQLGTGNLVPRSQPVGITGQVNVAQVVGGSNFALIRKTDGTVWYSGSLDGRQVLTFTQVSGLSNVTAIAAGGTLAYALLSSGSVFTIGNSPTAFGGLANVTAIVGSGASSSTFLARNSAGQVFGWGNDSSGQLCQGSTNGARPSPVLVPGISSPSSMAVSDAHSVFAVSGQVFVCGSNSRGALGLTVNQALTAQSVNNIFNVERVSAGSGLTVVHRDDGTVYSWGGGNSNQSTPNLGIGALSQRVQPGLVRAAAGTGTLSATNTSWALDVKASSPNFLPPGDTPKVLVDTTTTGSAANLSATARLVVRDTDVNRMVNVHVLGLLPRRFVTIIQNTLASRRTPEAKADSDLVLVQLTPTGWQVVTGQLTALVTNVVAGNQTAINILNNLNANLLTGGGSFCVGYGTNANDMLNEGTLAEALTLPGAAAVSGGLPCLRSGAYITGPATSNVGQPVTFNATVIGISAPGSVTLRNNGGQIVGPTALTVQNPAVSTAAFSPVLTGPALYNLTVVYPGDGGNNPASTSLAHQHSVVGVTNVTLTGPASSTEGAPVTFTATVPSGATGTIQFRDSGSNLGPAVTIASNQAQLTTSALAVGARSITAFYAGDTLNGSATSTALTHTVNGVVIGNPTISVAAGNSQSAAQSAAFAQPLRVLVRGPDMNPLANAQVSFAPPSTGPSVTLSAINVNTGADGTAQVTVTAGPNAGTAAITATIAAGAQVTFNLTISPPMLDPNGDADSDGIPNGVETTVGTNPNARDNDIFTTTTLGNRLFVMQQFRDFLGREGDSAGVAFWEGEFAAGRQTRTSMVESFFNSQEFQATGAPIARLYFATYLRIPDYSGLVFWTGQFRSGQALAAIGDQFATAPEFVAQYGALDNPGYVNRLYQNILGRPADAAGLDFWVGQLQSGTTRGAMLTNFSESAEYRARINNSVYVTMMYVGMLRRGPDQAGFDFWRLQMDGGRTGRDLIDQFIPAAEYRSRFL
jgi:alpha-tubulin suppressor-like RCC1 family protein